MTITILVYYLQVFLYTAGNIGPRRPRFEVSGAHAIRNTPQEDSIPRSEQSKGHRPAHFTARPLGMHLYLFGYAEI
jgi:hypothetical protein